MTGMSTKKAGLGASTLSFSRRSCSSLPSTQTMGAFLVPVLGSTGPEEGEVAGATTRTLGRVRRLSAHSQTLYLSPRREPESKIYVMPRVVLDLAAAAEAAAPQMEAVPRPLLQLSRKSAGMVKHTHWLCRCSGPGRYWRASRQVQALLATRSRGRR